MATEKKDIKIACMQNLHQQPHLWILLLVQVPAFPLVGEARKIKVFSFLFQCWHLVVPGDNVEGDRGGQCGGGGLLPPLLCWIPRWLWLKNIVLIPKFSYHAQQRKFGFDKLFLIPFVVHRSWFPPLNFKLWIWHPAVCIQSKAVFGGPIDLGGQFTVRTSWLRDQLNRENQLREAAYGLVERRTLLGGCRENTVVALRGHDCYASRSQQPPYSPATHPTCWWFAWIADGT